MSEGCAVPNPLLGSKKACPAKRLKRSPQFLSRLSNGSHIALTCRPESGVNRPRSLLNDACHSSQRPGHRHSLCPRLRHSRVPWPVTLVMMRGRGRGVCGTDAGRRRTWGASRTRTQTEAFLAVLSAANVAGRGTGSAGTLFVRVACPAADLSNGIIQQPPSQTTLRVTEQSACFDRMSPRQYRRL